MLTADEILDAGHHSYPRHDGRTPRGAQRDRHAVDRAAELAADGRRAVGGRGVGAALEAPRLAVAALAAALAGFCGELDLRTGKANTHGVWAFL